VLRPYLCVKPEEGWQGGRNVPARYLRVECMVLVFCVFGIRAEWCCGDFMNNL